MTMKSNKENSDHQGEKHLAAEASIGSDVTPNNSGVADTERVIDTSRENVVQPQIHAKRQQDNPFEANKKVRTFLNLGNGRSVNHFSQSTRMLQRRSSPPSLLDLFPVKSDHKPFTDKQPQHPARRLNFNVGSESMNMQGRTHSDPSSASSFLSRLNAVSSDTMNGPDEKRTTSSLMPPPPLARSRTFSGLTSIGNSSSSSQSFFEAKSPFLSLDSNRRSISKSNISKTSHLLPKRLGQNRSHLKQTVLDTPFLVKPPPLSFLSHASSSSSSTELTASRIGEQGKDLDSIEGVSDHEELESSVAPSLASCTAAMSTLSPPSAKVPYSLSDVTRQRRPSLADMKDSLSCPTLDTGSLSDSDDEQVSQLKVSSPCALLSKKSDSASISTTSSTLVSKRPMTLRRHQTMISSRSEFMKTLEPSGQRRSLSLIGALTKKSLVFAPENYVPDPLREDCQILPCANFVCKPDDTTKRVTPQTVVDVLDGKYKDKYDLLYIVDCRFPYEFKGGHIKSAVNVNTTDELEQLLLQPAITDKRVLLIFHCEFSCERGPRMARHLRNQDRAANSSHYPAVFYSEVYVMQGGYSGFFKENKTYCWPEAYVEMQDEKHAKEFEEHMRSFGREFSRSASKGFLGTESRKPTKRGFYQYS
ncbi:cell division cycle- protein [Entomortierella lignicola]|nr:cell division cycle- protein [Entomortierella lignicola]